MPANTQTHPCDLCGSDAPQEISVSRRYMGGQAVHVCKNCGFVYVRERRSAQAIADAWSDEIYGDGYTARIPAVKARQTYVADMIDVELGLAGKKLCDIGAGEGQFLEIVRSSEYGAEVFGIEPSAANCELMKKANMSSFEGTIESYLASEDAKTNSFDIATVMWTLENCQDCLTMLRAAHDLLVEGGHVVVSTGSRILVPFKKPLHYYLEPCDADTHAFRFSANSLQRALMLSGFETVAVNRFIDTDYLVMIGRKADAVDAGDLPKDDWREVVAFFDSWHEDTERFYKGK